MNSVHREVLRTEEYGQMGTVLALTSEYLGQPIDPETHFTWTRTLGRLSLADDLAERDPTLLTPGSLLDMLGAPVTDELTTAARDLINANERGRTTTSLTEHFASRKIEAVKCVDLLEYQSPYAIKSNQQMWAQLRALTVFGTYYDDVVDCKEDAQSLPQFTAGQLAAGALFHTIASLKNVEAQTLWASYKAATETGARQRIMRRILKPVMGAAT